MVIGKRTVARKVFSCLVGLSALAVLAWIARDLVTSPVTTHRRSTCSGRLRMHFRGLRSYLGNYDEYFPLAWHVSGARLSDDLGNLTYYRSLMTEFTHAGFSRFAGPGQGTELQKQKFAEIQKVWTDPTEGGWTRDYFVPEIIFRIPDPREFVYDKHTASTQLTIEASPTIRPLMADVNASLPNPEARDRHDPEHEAEMRKGFSTVQAAGMDVFVGVGQSLRRAGDCRTSRFDFRHRGIVNVLFLDGHVDMVTADNKARLEKIHRYWNSIDPASNKEPDK